MKKFLTGSVIVLLVLAVAAFAFFRAFGSTDTEAYRQKVREKNSDVIFVYPADEFAVLKYGMAAYAQGNTGVCDRFQRPYVPRAPEMELATSIRLCKEVAGDIDRLALSSPDLRTDLRSYVEEYVVPLVRSYPCEKGLYCDEFTENTDRLMDYFDTLPTR